jgi:hypothetical protein
MAELLSEDVEIELIEKANDLRLQMLEQLKVLVYTIITNDYDEERQNKFSGCDWKIISGDGRKESRREKCLPPHFWDYDYSIYIDGNLELCNHPYRLIMDCLEGFDIATFKHPSRCCAFQEAEAVIRKELDEKKIVRNQLRRYKREGFPVAYGLGECCLLVRRHNQAIWDFGEKWWEEITNGSWRDQLSFDYVSWKLGVPVCKIPGGGKAGSSLVKMHPHLKPKINYIYS